MEDNKPNQSSGKFEIKTRQFSEAREINGGSKNKKSDPSSPTTARSKADKEKIFNKLNKEIDEISISNDEAMTGIRKLSSTLTNLLDENTTALPEQGIVGKAQKINEPDVFNIEGNTKKKLPFAQLINAQIEESTQRVTLYNHTGVYGKILEVRQNSFMESNLPILKTSLSFFVDDVLNGSFRGDDYDVYQKFKYYKNGAEDDNAERVSKMNDILEPKSYADLMTGVKPWSTIATSFFYSGRKDGFVLARVIPHKEIAKDLYIKYVMKEDKKEQLKKKKFEKKDKAKAKDVAAVEDINLFLDEFGIEKIGMETDLFVAIPKEILDEIPEQLYTVTTSYYNEDGEDIALESADYTELNTDETFLEFCERMLSGKAHKIYNINLKGNRNEVIGGEAFTYEMNSVSSSVGKGILDEIRTACGINGLNNMITNQIAVESIDRDLNPIDKINMNNISFEDIYNSGSFTIANNCGIAMESIDDNILLEKLTPENTVDRMYLKIRKSLELKMDKIAMEAGQTGYTGYHDNTLNPSFGVMELGGAPLDTKGTAYVDPKSPYAEEKIKEAMARYGRLEKMFGTIKGETTEILDSTRTIPIMGGDRLIGCYFIEYTHQDIQHFIGMRTVLGNPIAYTQNIDMLNIRTEEQEETLGRMIFTDTIQPLLDKNMDTKFLKDNASILYCLKQLLEENEIGQSLSFQDMTRYNMYNMSRIIFIPGNQLIFGRHGETGLGTSTFTEALVPANAAILANEAYLSWILCDGKGMSFVQVPRGMSEIGGENGIDNLRMRIDDLMTSRAKLRDVAYNNFPLCHKIILMEKGEEATEDIEIKSLEFPQFQIDQEQINRWIQEATNIVGYNSASFSSIDGTVELAKKLYEIDDTKLLEILKCRRMFKLAFSQLATKLLQVRGGEAYKDYTVEWVEPPVERNNNIKRSEIAKETADTMNTYMEIYEQAYGNDELWEGMQPFIVRELLDRLVDKDTLLKDMESVVQDAKNRLKVTTTEMVEEETSEEEEKKGNANEASEEGEEEANNDNEQNENNAENDEGDEA